MVVKSVRGLIAESVDLCVGIPFRVLVGGDKSAAQRQLWLSTSRSTAREPPSTPHFTSLHPWTIVTPEPTNTFRSIAAEEWNVSCFSAADRVESDFVSPPPRAPHPTHPSLDPLHLWSGLHWSGIFFSFSRSRAYSLCTPNLTISPLLFLFTLALHERMAATRDKLLHWLCLCKPFFHNNKFTVPLLLTGRLEPFFSFSSSLPPQRNYYPPTIIHLPLESRWQSYFFSPHFGKYLFGPRTTGRSSTLNAWLDIPKAREIYFPMLWWIFSTCCRRNESGCPQECRPHIQTY